MNASGARPIPTRITSAVRALRVRLEHRFAARLRELCIFGSYARGDWGPGSDVDVLVVVEGLTHRERHDVSDEAEEVFFQTLVRLSPLALSTSEIATLRAREYLIASEIERDGVPS